MRGCRHCEVGGGDYSLGSFDHNPDPNPNPYTTLHNAFTPAIHNTNTRAPMYTFLCEFISNDSDARDRTFAISWSSGEREVTFSEIFDEASSYECAATTPGFMTMTLRREK